MWGGVRGSEGGGERREKRSGEKSEVERREEGKKEELGLGSVVEEVKGVKGEFGKEREG